MRCPLATQGLGPARDAAALERQVLRVRRVLQVPVHQAPGPAAEPAELFARMRRLRGVSTG
jgi:hypothetical protein